ncbi:prion-inhibition and propagation-domain-containing protein [Diplogelasinospora grovesii]|uniref:Prion-inhibition and propagation-domain-containing protein n=1 Tax=Diplogelasinospora grovesii TaxID=303347 RepID=A0AAN6S145_9PEZI|nr:prion-inhibition and propagation-domain-containing protein [Diplogelasinospora grovesii]
MAETFGVIAGAMSIAALSTSCVECFDYIQIGRRCGEDFQTELLTLRFLKLRLSRWGAAVQVYDDPPPPLATADLELAKDTLGQILALFDETEKVSRKFYPEAKRDENIVEIEPKFVALHSKITSLIGKRLTGLTVTKRQRIKWVLHDRERLSNLTQSVTKLLHNLEQEFPAPEAQTALAKAEASEIIESITDSEQKQPILYLVGEVATGVDRLFRDELAGLTAKNTIGHIVCTGDAKIRDGDFYSNPWRGVKEVPQSGSMSIKSIHASGNSRVMNGHTYGGDKDSFWD